MGSIAELWVYPVKVRRGVSVKSVRVTNTGFELDRAFCVVDTTGNVVWKDEAISQRALPVLATIDVALSARGDKVTLSTPGMRKLNVPTVVEAYHLPKCSRDRDILMRKHQAELGCLRPGCVGLWLDHVPLLHASWCMAE